MTHNLTTVAGSTSTRWGTPPDAGILHDPDMVPRLLERMRLEKAAYLQAFEGETRRYEGAVARLLIACASSRGGTETVLNNGYPRHPWGGWAWGAGRQQ